MNITELAPGTQITVSILIDDMQVNIKTSAIYVFEDALLVSPLKYHGAPIPAFTQGSATALLPNNYSTSFYLSSIVPYENWNDVYYLIKGSEIITEFSNKRKAERYVTNSLGKLTLAHNHTMSAIIYDVSIKGVSLLLGKTTSIKIGDQFTLTFKPEGFTKTIEVPLVVVRSFKVGTYSAVGCKMRGIDPQLMSYIISLKKQKEEYRKIQSQSKAIVDDRSAASA